MNRQQIREEIRRLIKDVDTTNARWSDTVLNTRIDLSHDNVASITKCIPYRYTTNLLANTAEYVMPSYFLEATDVLILNDNSQYYPLIKETEISLDEKNALWRDDSGSPVFWYQRINSIGLVPYPESAKTNGLRVDMAKLPTAFTADSDIAFDSITDLYAYHKVICYDVAVMCALDDGNDKNYALFKQEYNLLIRKIISQMNSKSSETRMPNIYETARRNNRRSK